MSNRLPATIPFADLHAAVKQYVHTLKASLAADLERRRNAHREALDAWDGTGPKPRMETGKSAERAMRSTMLDVAGEPDAIMINGQAIPAEGGHTWSSTANVWTLWQWLESIRKDRRRKFAASVTVGHALVADNWPMAQYRQSMGHDAPTANISFWIKDRRGCAAMLTAFA